MEIILEKSRMLTRLGPHQLLTRIRRFSRARLEHD